MKQNFTAYKYPCTRNIGINGFGTFLEKEIGEPRRNLRLFAKELSLVITGGIEDISGQMVMTNSGSSANLAAALAIAEKLRRNNRPLTAAASAFTFPTTISSLLLAGFNVSLIDTEKNDFNISADELEKLPVPPSLVVCTHFLGFPADMERLMQYKTRTGCIILQDACETLVSRFKGKPLYQYGDIITWSFYHPHHLSSYGGGAVYAKDKADFILCDSVAHWGRACKCHIDEELCNVPFGPGHQFTYENIGVNVEMSELNACFGRWQLMEWGKIEKQRKNNYAYLYEKLKNNAGMKVWDFYNEEKDSPFVFPVLAYNKDIKEAWEILSSKGIEIRTLMGGAASMQKAYRRFIPEDKKYPNAEYMSRYSFFVGCHHTLTQEDIQYIANELSKL